jgi:hypothetical protein
VYFDPNQNKYKTISVEPIPLVISQGNEKPTERETPLTDVVIEVPFYVKYKSFLMAGAGCCNIGIHWFDSLEKERQTTCGCC